MRSISLQETQDRKEKKVYLETRDLKVRWVVCMALSEFSELIPHVVPSLAQCLV